MKICIECNGDGYFTNVLQLHKIDGIDNSIEKCDNCNKFKNDEQAKLYHKENK